MIEPGTLMAREVCGLMDVRSGSLDAVGRVAAQFEQVSKGIHALACARQKALRLSRTQIRAIVALDEHDEGLKAATVGLMLAVSSSVSSEITRSLIQRGLARRRMDDGRHLGPLILTEAGKSVAATIRDWDRALREAVCRLSPLQLKSAEEILDFITSGISAE